MKTLQLPKVQNFDADEYQLFWREILEVLRHGGIIIYPTETCYGIGVDATNQNAVDKLLAYKSKRGRKPLSIAVADIDMARQYAEINEMAENLYKNYLPGPLTVVSKDLGNLAIGVGTPEGSVGIRVPDYPLILELVRRFGKPITASSANASYQKRPYSVQDIFDYISDKQKRLIDLVIDAGELPPNEPSTVVDTTLNDTRVLRQGRIFSDQSESFVSNSPEESEKIAYDLMKRYTQYLGYKSVIFAMSGEMGSGKTVMTKGIARALDVSDDISSPTFVIERNYPISGMENSYLSRKQIELIHIDTWRLHEGVELETLGFFEKIENCNVLVIEWADKVMDLIDRVSEDAIILFVDIVYGEREGERMIRFSSSRV